MKVKVLRYTADGNTVVRPYMDLTPYPGVEHAFTALCKTEYGRDYHYLVLEFNGVYINDGITGADTLFAPTTAQVIRDAYAVYLSAIPERNYPQIIHVELYKALGMDPAPLIAKREAVKAERARLAAEKSEKLKEAMHAESVKHELELKVAHQALRDGKMIDVLDFWELCDDHGVKLPIRTKGMLNRLKQCFVGTTEVSYSARPGHKPTFSHVFAAAKQLAAEITPAGDYATEDQLKHLFGLKNVQL